MKKISVLIFSSLIFFSQLGYSETKTANLTTISVINAQIILTENIDNEEFQLIDVRTAAEYEEGHLLNAQQIDFYADSFDNELSKLDKNKTYMLYCRTGYRSGKTLAKMKKLGFSNVYNVDGGIVNWQDHNLDIELAK